MNPNPEQPKSLKDTILTKIQQEEVTMRPKTYFTLKVAALGILTLAVLVVSVLIVNFISFSIRINGHDSLLSFGSRGLIEFLLLFPWELLLLDAILIFILEWLVRKFQFGYRSPILFMLLGLLAITISLGLFIDRVTTTNDHFLHEAQEHRLPPPLQGLYHGVRQPPSPTSGTCKCTITTIHGNILTANEIDPDTTTSYTIIAPPADPLLPTLKVGDTIFVFGDRASTTIHAFGLRPLPPDRN